MDGREWLSAYLERMTEIGARAVAVQEVLAGIEATASSVDGAVTTSVNPAGAMLRLAFSERADALPRAQLAAAVLATARIARAQAARRALEAMLPLVGSYGEAMRVLRAHLPVDGGET
jgi:phage-related tail protein